MTENANEKNSGIGIEFKTPRGFDVFTLLFRSPSTNGQSTRLGNIIHDIYFALEAVASTASPGSPFDLRCAQAQTSRQTSKSFSRMESPTGPRGLTPSADAIFDNGLIAGTTRVRSRARTRSSGPRPTSSARTFAPTWTARASGGPDPGDGAFAQGGAAHVRSWLRSIQIESAMLSCG